MTQATLELGEPRPRPSMSFGDLQSALNGWCLDAQPFVMQRARTIFKGSSPLGKGKHTHERILIGKTKDNAKDLVWFCDRYPLDIEAEAWPEIDRLAAQYDSQLRAAMLGDRDQTFKLSPIALQMAEPPRPHQSGFCNLFRQTKRMLLADVIGLGKTISAIATLCEPDARPALVVVPVHLARQWEKQLARFLPGATVKVLRSGQKKELPEVDVVIISYSKLKTWQDVLVPRKFRTVICDEVQDLRHFGTEKRRVASALCAEAEYTLGLSATPIYNMGAEIWSVLDALSRRCLGDSASFFKEWCSWEKVANPVALNSYLTAQGLMLRRTKKDIGIVEESVTKDVITLEANLEELSAIKNVARLLALSVLRNEVGISNKDANELDWKLRHATGVAKAKAVAAFVRMIVETGEKVLLTGWHRDVYDIWLKELRDLQPVLCTGTESPAQKAKSINEFTSRAQCKVFICSNRSGAGIDGLQQVCSNIVIGELDWSPHVMDQLIGRLDREGQTKPVNAYFPIIEDGSDPFIMEVLGEKRSQHDGLVEGKTGQVEILEDVGVRSDRIRAMAEAYLASIGETVTSPEPQTGLHADIVRALRKLALPANSEKELQESVFAYLPDLIPGATIEREVKFGERNRLDFLVTQGHESIAIECKMTHTDKGAVYRQIRRYITEIDITGAVLLAPWSGVANFSVEGVPVTIVDWAKQKL